MSLISYVEEKWFDWVWSLAIGTIFLISYICFLAGHGNRTYRSLTVCFVGWVRQPVVGLLHYLVEIVLSSEFRHFQVINPPYLPLAIPK